MAGWLAGRAGVLDDRYETFGENAFPAVQRLAPIVHAVVVAVDDHRFVFLQVELVVQLRVHVEEHGRIGETGDRRPAAVRIAQLVRIVFEFPDVVRRKDADTGQIEQFAFQPLVVHLPGGDDDVIAIQRQIAVLLLAERAQRHVDADRVLAQLMLDVHLDHLAQRKLAALVVAYAQVPVLVDLADHLQNVARLQA